MADHEHSECKNLLISLSDYIDGEANEALCLEIERHLAGCRNCRVVVDTLRKTVSLYQATSDPVELPAGVRERLYHTLNLENYIKH